MRATSLVAACCLLVAPAFAQDGAPPGGNGTPLPASSGATPPRTGNAGPQSGGAIVPSAYQNAFTNSANSIPFSWVPTKFQSVYLGSEMPSSQVIRCIAYRHGNRDDRGATIDMEIQVGYTTFDHNTITNNYAQNFNSGSPVVVFKRKLWVVPDMVAANTSPTFFVGQIPLDQTFVWQQQTGRNLLVQVTVYGNSQNNDQFRYYIEQTSGANTTRLYSTNDPNASFGTITRGLGPVYCFSGQCIPSGTVEPFGVACRGTGGVTHQSQHIVPAALRTRWGNGINGWTLGSGPQRWQQEINASEMPTSPTTFLTYAQRDDTAVRWVPANTMNLKVLFGMTTYNKDTLTNNYAMNANRPQTVVFDGQVNMPATQGGNNNLNNFEYIIPLSRPYIYVPTANEHFLIEIVNTTPVRVYRYPDAEASTAAMGARVYANGQPTAATGVLNNNHCVAISFGTKLGPGNLPPILRANGRPAIGKSFAIELAQAAANAPALLFLGFSEKQWGAIPLPLDLAVLGAPGCPLLVSPDASFPALTSKIGNTSISLPVPNLQSFVGFGWFHQWLVIDKAANNGGLVTSNGGRVVVGAQ